MQAETLLLVGETLIAIANLPPRPMMGIDSCGMVISAIHREGGQAAPQPLMVALSGGDKHFS